MESKEVTLDMLVGLKLLTGVEYVGDEWLKQFERTFGYGDYHQANGISFILDGKTYTAVENESDGYRSNMETLLESDIPLTNTFDKVRVFGIMKQNGSYGNDCDILGLWDVVTAKLVLEVGTDYSDSYYPSFVGNFKPENMAINQEKG